MSALAELKRRVNILPDNGRWLCRFDIRSQTSKQVYRVSFDSAMVCWICSCRGCIRWGQCKHLDAMGLKGRNHRNCLENKQYMKELMAR